MKPTPEKRAQAVQENMIRVTADCVRGAHDAQTVIARNKAYIVYEANDVRPGENPAWPDNYAAMSILDF